MVTSLRSSACGVATGSSDDVDDLHPLVLVRARTRDEALAVADVARLPLAPVACLVEDSVVPGRSRWWNVRVRPLLLRVRASHR